MRWWPRARLTLASRLVPEQVAAGIEGLVRAGAFEGTIGPREFELRRRLTARFLGIDLEAYVRRDRAAQPWIKGRILPAGEGSALELSVRAPAEAFGGVVVLCGLAVVYSGLSLLSWIAMSIHEGGPAWPLEAWEVLPLGVAALAWLAMLAWFEREVRLVLRLLAPVGTPCGERQTLVRK